MTKHRDQKEDTRLFGGGSVCEHKFSLRKMLSSPCVGLQGGRLSSVAETAHNLPF